jgi:hypothetical protein
MSGILIHKILWVLGFVPESFDLIIDSSIRDTMDSIEAQRQYRHRSLLNRFFPRPQTVVQINELDSKGFTFHLRRKQARFPDIVIKGKATSSSENSTHVVGQANNSRMLLYYLPGIFPLLLLLFISLISVGFSNVIIKLVLFLVTAFVGLWAINFPSLYLEQSSVLKRFLGSLPT